MSNDKWKMKSTLEANVKLKISYGSDSDGRRANVAWRACVRYLLATAQRQHHISWDTHRRSDCEFDRRATAFPRSRRPGERHQPLHQPTGWRSHGGTGDLRYDPIHSARRHDDLRRHVRLDGRAVANCGRERKTLCFTKFSHSHSSTLGRHAGSSDRCPHSRGRTHTYSRADLANSCQTYWSEHGSDRTRRGTRSIFVCRPGEGIWFNRRGDRAPRVA